DVTVTASVGCAATMEETADQVIARADQAMYLAKRSGDAIVLARQAPDHDGPQDPSPEDGPPLSRPGRMLPTTLAALPTATTASLPTTTTASPTLASAR
nr:diguanylate cyclase [Chloroflexota bacterium]